jgi:hypothetical protein
MDSFTMMRFDCKTHTKCIMNRAVSFILFLPLFAGAQTVLNNYVVFQNGVLNPPPDRLVRFADGSPMVGANFMAQLLVGATPDSLQPTTAAPAPFRAPGTMFAGMWIGYLYGSFRQCD